MLETPMSFTRPRLQTVLLQRGLISADQLAVALNEKKRSGALLGKTLVDLKFMSPAVLQQTLAALTGLGVKDFTDTPFLPLPQLVLPLEMWQHCCAVPFSHDPPHLHIAMADPENVLLTDHLRRALKDKDLVPCFYHADPVQIEKILAQESTASTVRTEEGALKEVDFILTEAIENDVSDIHFHPEAGYLKIRYRQDGLLKTVRRIHKEAWPAMAVCLKVMSGLDIAETRRPQGGAFQHLVRGQHVDFRVSSHPTTYGETIVIRALNKDKVPMGLQDLGFSQAQITTFRHLIKQPQGLILFSGPTGSGKTTSLYAIFSEIDRETRNIVTLEEPVEYHLDGIRQTEIKEGLVSFAEGLRSILRQDPDVIFIGEIRDSETAVMALRAAMTGHLVFATLHTNDTCSVPARLIDLGVSPTLLAGNILAAVAQRLVRRLCHSCGGNGCPTCYETGYKGRFVIAEILPFTQNLHALVAQGGNSNLIRQHCAAINFKTLADDARDKVENTLTTSSEVARVLGEML